jgi:hypothetical protein
MYSGQATQGRKITHRHVARKLNPVGELNPLSQLTVMGHVTVSHQQILIANPGRALAAGMEGDEFSNIIIMANF